MTIEHLTSESSIEPLLQIKPTKVLPTSYFWGQKNGVETGYALAHTLMPDTCPASWERVVNTALAKLKEVFDAVENSSSTSSSVVAELSLSDELRAWRDDQQKAGRLLPSKGYGLSHISKPVIHLLNAENWAEPLLTNAACFGSGFANFLVGASDAQTFYSNYCTDMGFYVEHGYHKFFPEFESMLKKANTDSSALKTLGGMERRAAVDIGLKYIREKHLDEQKTKGNLAFKTARLTRDEALVINFCECSILGMAAEALARGFDIGGVVNDFAFSSPGTDTVDVGSDFYNLELFNGFLNTKDITESGIITEEALRRVYDAYAHSGARMFTERWSDPGARMCATLYTWHIQNDRHYFYRRAVLGSSKMRTSGEQRVADWDEAFDEDFHTTGYSRPLPNACDGHETCDQVKDFIAQSYEDPLLKELWYFLSNGPVEYVCKGVVDGETEKHLTEGLRIAMARAYSCGLVDEMTWLMAHANQHAWQVNYLFEAAMFGSLLDDNGLRV